VAEKFEIGEIAVLIGTVNFHEYLGQDVEIIGGLEMRNIYTSRDRMESYDALRYLVITSNGHRLAVRPEYLRKKRPPPQRQELGEWELCPWKPAQPVTVSGDHGD
jgi:hypothetical protein